MRIRNYSQLDLSARSDRSPDVVQRLRTFGSGYDGLLGPGRAHCDQFILQGIAQSEASMVEPVLSGDEIECAVKLRTPQVVPERVQRAADRKV
jgi:hypothetical protein